jgi:glycosyltransferase involved in cell wall biosynthesis
MKIVMLTNVVAPDKLGGLERYVRELSAALVRRGHEVVVVSKRTRADQPMEEVGEDGVQLRRYSAPSKKDPLFALKYPRSIAQSVQRAMSDVACGDSSEDVVIHGHFPVPMLGVHRSQRYVYTFHAPVHKEILGERQGSYALPRMARRPAVGILKALETRVLRKASHVATLSNFTHGEMTALTGDRAPTWSRIPGGLDTRHFSPDAGTDAPETFGNGPLIVAARRLVERTGVENLVMAMPAVLERYPTTHLVLTGDGPRREAIESYVNNVGLARSVHLRGRISDQELLDWYRVADLTVTPTLELEGFGLSTAESMSCGTPALVTPVGANPEVVAGLGSDFVTKSNKPADIAAGLLALLGEPEKLRAAGVLSRGLIHPDMSWDHVARTYCDIYEQFLAAGNRSTAN